MRRILIVGGTSAIAEAAARLWAQRGDYLFLVARNRGKLEAIASDLRIRGGARIEVHCMDANDLDGHVVMLDAAEKALGGLDMVLIAHGTLPDQAACQQSIDLTLHEIRTNALSVISLLTHVANRFEQQASGTILVVSSVAGDRGRQSNYVYVSAKAMVSAFASGLRQRLHKCGVAVTTIKPGFVDTPMTSQFKKGILWSSPDRVAARIVSASDGKGGVIYTPGYWRLIMAVIRGLPESIFRRITL